jgi:hypothetical protein
MKKYLTIMVLVCSINAFGDDSIWEIFGQSSIDAESHTFEE